LGVDLLADRLQARGVAPGGQASQHARDDPLGEQIG